MNIWKVRIQSLVSVIPVEGSSLEGCGDYGFPHGPSEC